MLLIGLFITGPLVISLIAPSSSARAESRWYDQSSVEKGSTLFRENCSACHGFDAEGTLNWKKTDGNGKYPPPPLNGTAHTWHHSIETLKETIQEGGISIGGSMPAFKSRLSDEDQGALIAYFQSKWADDIYLKWAGRYQLNDKPPKGSTDKQSNNAPVDKNKMTRLLRSRLGSKKLSDPIRTPVDEIYQTRFNNQYAYLTQDGRFVFIGKLIDLETGINLTAVAKRKFIITELNRVSLEDKVIFPATGVEKAVINVFTDTTCPYCRKFHEEVGKLQEAGISIHYLPYPRGGQQGPGYQPLRQVWCAKDKQKAMGIAKELDTGDLPPGDCEKGNFVDEGFALGNRVGITGTPSLFKSNGENIQGYVPYQQLIPRIFSN